MTTYPLTGPASTIACPRHGLAIALGEDGRIVSTCPACVRVAEKALIVLLSSEGGDRHGPGHRVHVGGAAGGNDGS